MARPQVLSPIAHNSIPVGRSRARSTSGAGGTLLHGGSSSISINKGKAKQQHMVMAVSGGDKMPVERGTSTGGRGASRGRAVTHPRTGRSVSSSSRSQRGAQQLGARAAAAMSEAAAAAAAAAGAEATTTPMTPPRRTRTDTAHRGGPKEEEDDDDHDDDDSASLSSALSSPYSSAAENGTAARAREAPSRDAMRHASDSSALPLPPTQPLPDATGSKQQQQQQSVYGAQSRRKGTRQTIAEIFSPMRAMRVAKAGMKRKHGDGARRTIRSHLMQQSQPVLAASTNGATAGGITPSAADRPDDDDVHENGTTPPTRPRHPRRASRDISSSYLRRNMRALVLSDRDEATQQPGCEAPPMTRRESSSRSTRTASRASSYQRHVSGGSSRGSRSRNSTVIIEQEKDQEALEEDRDEASQAGDQAVTDFTDAFQDEHDGEVQRLLSQAPSWQLNRLNKTQLSALHVRLGTWMPEEKVDTDAFTKQELVDGIIKSRSADSKPVAPSFTPNLVPGPSLTAVASRQRRRSSNFMDKSLTLSSLTSLSSEYTDDSEGADDVNSGFQARAGGETDANDAAGEETEAEPVKPLRRRTRQHGGIEVATNGASPIVHRLRHIHSRHKLRGLGGSTANATFAFNHTTEGSKGSGDNNAGRQSYVATSPIKRRLRHQASVAFAASSPARTRARTRNQSSSSSRRTSLSATRGSRTHQQRTLRANADGELTIDGVPSLPHRRQQRSRDEVEAAAKARQQRLQGAKANNYSDESDDGDRKHSNEQDWEDDSPPPPWRATSKYGNQRPAKVHAQRQLLQNAAEDSEALVEEVLCGHDEDGMSVSARRVVGPSRASKGTSRAPPSKMSLDDSDEISEDEDDEDCLSDQDLVSETSENEVQASPTKIRRLRNGKVRLPATPLAEKGDPTDMAVNGTDVEMDEASGDEDASDNLSQSSLNKMRRDQLIELCKTERVAFAKDATKAVLVDTLLAHRKSQPPSSTQTTRPGDSSASARTARPQNSARSTRGAESDVPLLLRSGSMPTQGAKPGTPAPTQQGEEELNGLDLESLNLVDKEIPFSKLEKLDKIGSGGFKDVYVGKYHITKKTSKKVAIADIRDQLNEMDIKELTLLRDLKHENIVRFIGVSIPPPDMRLSPCMIVSELCSNGDLYDYIRNTDAPPDQDVFRIMLETARGLEYLHTRTPAIIHRDCKSTNVLVTRNRTAKINDFGLARVRNNKRSMIKSLVGTVNWQAVELWSPKPSYNEKVDVWSAGMTFWETLQWHQPEKKYPFQDMNEHQIYLDVGHKKLRPPTISIRRRFGSEIVDLLDRMWDHNPKERPTMTQVCTELEELVVIKREAAAAAAAVAASGVEPSVRRASGSAGTGIRPLAGARNASR